MRSIQFMLVMLWLVVGHASVAQDEEKQILLSGHINCIDPLNGTMARVVVYNINQGLGTMSNEDGTFAIPMAKTDTILFSTAEHKDYRYFLPAGQAFEDHKIEVVMLTDAIWLNTVTIIGAESLEQFKRDVLALDPGQQDVELTLPLVNKYARQLSTGKGETDLVGPLTYLQNKFSRHYILKKKATIKSP